MSTLSAPNRAWPGLATALRAVLGVLVLAYALSLVVDVWRWRMVSGWIDDRSTISVSEARSSDSWALAIGGLTALLMLATLVLFIIWLYQAHASRAMNRDYMEHRSGWAIGGWFVPFLNWVRPCQMVQDVRRGSFQDYRSPSALTIVWWVPFLLGSLFNWVAALMSDAPGDADAALTAFRNFAVTSTIADALQLVAAVAGTLLVTVVTREVLARHAAVTQRLATSAPPPPGAAPLRGSTPPLPRTP